MRRRGLPAIVAVALAVPAAADVSLVQIVQSQTSGGEDGYFGKTWVQVSGRRMRLISGYARKVGDKTKKNPEPLRLIQTLDLPTTSLLRVDPARKSYSRGSLADIRYAGPPPGARRPAQAAVRNSRVTLEKGKLRRRFMDRDWEHYRITVRMRLKNWRAGESGARMEQDVWVAPVSGGLQQGLLDIMTFESEFRRLTKDSFSPLDYTTYQAREAAAYLGVPEKDLRGVLRLVKEAFSGIPGYPLSSSVSWWREAPEGGAAEAAPPRLKRIPTFYPVRSRFTPVDMSAPWRIIDKMADTLRAGSEEESGSDRRYPEYTGFQREMQRVVRALEIASPESPAPGPAAEPAPPGAPSPAPDSEGAPVPFYQVFTELDAFTYVPTLPPEDFHPPKGYKQSRVTAR